MSLKQLWNKPETNFVLFQFYFSFISHVRAALKTLLKVSLFYIVLTKIWSCSLDRQRKLCNIFI